jgi:hypothetical protein
MESFKSSRLINPERIIQQLSVALKGIGFDREVAEVACSTLLKGYNSQE